MTHATPFSKVVILLIVSGFFVGLIVFLQVLSQSAQPAAGDIELLRSVEPIGTLGVDHEPYITPVIDQYSDEQPSPIDPNQISDIVSLRETQYASNPPTPPDPDWVTHAGTRLPNGGYRFEPGLAPEWQHWLDNPSAANAPVNLYGVLQFQVPFDPEWDFKLEALRSIGVQGLIYHQTNSLASAIIPRRVLPIINEWIADGLLRYAGPIPVEARTEQALLDLTHQNSSAPIPITLTLFELPNGQAGLLYLYPNYQVYSNVLQVSITGWVDPADLMDLAELPPVQAITWRDPEFCVYMGFEKHCSIEPTPSR